MTSHWINGWRLTGLLSVLLTLMVIAIVGLHDFSIDGIRMAIRATARTSLILFLPVFAASALARLWPGDATRWLRRNRRYLGVSFAASHGLHAIVIAAFAIGDPALFRSMTSIGTLISGGSAYLVIMAMAATSFDRAVSWLGPRNWRALHWLGGWYIAVSFIVTNAKRIPDMPLYWLPVVLVLAAIALRLVSWWQGRRAPRMASAPV
ncbi:MAG: ferric reductase-like transmembrane domain-containing protein [Ferrovibrio sp.]|uniref:ferric reductase-like transmembrane domain-containing protein n=1 Tax=Ferrovibrio sp. TaxID=1917215 RepID=UPI00261FE25C|nr:ferric reductase-like transmembrane domain-containing protein [Ferrovibrio sp.]MCW0235330.1 ferric reductase-like transmembrane domain-containing protein [Ferrovibrio sp.]